MIVCLCGSRRFEDYFHKANRLFTLKGKIVLMPGAYGECTLPEKVDLDYLHLKKIDMADEIHVLNVGGYIGESTTNEIVHALSRGMRITFFDSTSGRKWLHEHGVMIAERITARSFDVH
tara:strand:- start:2384 stop:2740 length:357 start_codon:yes stop_codon:yes gene_type:complete